MSKPEAPGFNPAQEQLSEYKLDEAWASLVEDLPEYAEMLQTSQEFGREWKENQRLIDMAEGYFNEFGLMKRHGVFPRIIFEATEQMTEQKPALLLACKQFARMVEDIRNIEVGFVANNAENTFTIVFGDENSVAAYGSFSDSHAGTSQEDSFLFTAHSHPKDPNNRYRTEMYSLNDLECFIDCLGATESYIFAQNGKMVLTKTKPAKDVQSEYKSACDKVDAQDKHDIRTAFIAIMIGSQNMPFDNLPEYIRKVFERIGIRYDYEAEKADISS